MGKNKMIRLAPASKLFASALLLASWWLGPRPAASTSVTCSSLAEVVASPRWLSLPLSRLVLNPHIEAPPPAPGFASPELALNLAIYAGQTPTVLPGLWSWQLQPPVGSVLKSGPRLGFTPDSAPLWTASGVSPEFESGRLRLRVTDARGGYGSLSREVTVDLEQTPFLVIQAAGGSGGWALKANDGTQAVDTSLVHDTSQSGTFAVDVAAATGWRGLKTFRVVLFAVGGAGKTAGLSRLQFFGRPASSRLLPGSTTWFPHQIITGAASAEGALSVQSTTALLDQNTVAQRLTVKRVPRPGSARLLLTGQFTSGSVRWDAARRVLLLQGEHFRAALACSRPARWLGVRASGLEWAAGEDNSGASSGPASGVWALALDNLRAGEQVVVAARFKPTASAASTWSAASKMASPARFAAQLRLQERAWNRRLQSVPRPLDFAIRAVEPRGVSAAEVRRAYYTAWAFLLCNSLPPLPENGFAFPQQATGKPSLWSEGDPRARASAQWDSLLAMQAMALADPASTWDAFEGMMSLVRPDGSMSGEGLPSCHARTAWILYQQTGDGRRLRRLYPAIKRLLLWKAANPRWIFHGSTSPDSKDQEFVVHALVDTGFAARIATALRMPAEVQLWREQRRTLAASLHKWFWQGEGGPPYRIYLAASGQRAGPDEPWNLQALALPPELLQPWARASLLRLFEATFSREVPFLVPNLSRFPNFELVRRGLWQGGDAARADALADAAMRDVTLAGEFAEFYGQNAWPPTPMGVWPSAFGARHIIDGVLWHNGVIADEGLPVLLQRPVKEPGVYGVENLSVRGQPASILFEGGRPVVRGTSARPQVLAGG